MSLRNDNLEVVRRDAALDAMQTRLRLTDAAPESLQRTPPAPTT
ncbi:MAG TPA: hypothetical protein VGC59_15555 [Solirubrobacteraceae bacterium]|jgi:hypothetical protein